VFPYPVVVMKDTVLRSERNETQDYGGNLRKKQLNGRRQWCSMRQMFECGILARFQLSVVRFVAVAEAKCLRTETTRLWRRASDIGASIFRMFKALGPAARELKRTVWTPSTREIAHS
jgi:hypothetical protein